MLMRAAAFAHALPRFLCCRVRCHIVHLSSAQSLQLIREAREAGAPLTVETTHHYLSLTAEDVPTGATQFKCCPPIRGAENQVSERQHFLQYEAETRRHEQVSLPTGAAVVGAEGRAYRHGGVGPLALHPRAEEAGQWRLYSSMGRNLLPAVW